MTRMFFHLCLVFLFISMTSCTMFSDSEESVSASEMEGEADNIEIESADAGDGSEDEDFEDLDIETADSAVASGGSADDSFGDIENFNEDQLDGELSSENIATNSVELDDQAGGAQAPAGETEDLDLEVANLEPPADTPVTAEEEPAITSGGGVGTGGNRITNLEYKSQESGGSVVITAESPFEYQVREEPEFNQTVIEIADVELPDRFKLPYIAKDFAQAVATVNAYQDAGSSTARFVIQYKDKLKPAIQMSGNQLLVMNSGTSMNVAGTGKGGKKASGKKISLEMQDVNIKDLIYFIADEVGANIIVDDTVEKTTSVKLKDVPWEEALDIILKTNGLTYERRGEILRVATVEAMTEEFSAEAKRLEAQDAALRSAQSRALKVIPINYADLEDMVTQVKPFLTTTGNAIVDKRSSSIIINDFDAPLARAEKLIRSLDVQPIQVQIEGKVIEANEQFSREFGIQWSQSGGNVEVGDQALTFNNSVRGEKSPGAVAGGFLTSLTYGTLDSIGDLTASLAIFERQEKVKILASPKIVTLNKEAATIEATQPVPIFQTTLVQGSGSQTQVSFTDARLLLTVTPQVSFNSDLILDISVARDVPGPAVGAEGSRGLSKRSAKTKVIVKDGQSLVIGGIFSQDETYTEGGVPLLKDIPILGYLFKTKFKEIIKSELVIFLTPKILNPEGMLKTTEITSSGDVVQSPNDTEEQSSESPSGSDSEESFDEIENEVESL